MGSAHLSSTIRCDRPSDSCPNKSACSSATRGVFGGGTDTDNTIDYVTILTTGNAVDFGDLTQGRRNAAACSNAHGGL